MDRRKTEHHNQGERDEAGTAAARDPAATQSPLKETRKKRNREEIVNDRDEKHVKEKKDKEQEDEKQDDAKIEKESEFSEEEVFRGIESASFKLTDSCNLYLHRGDITLWFVDGQYDAIVNAANKGLLGGGGVDRAIHMAAGPSLLEACRKIPKVFQNTRCPVGEARITSGFNLKAAYCIHTVGPIYEREEDPAAKLKDSYRNSLELANRNAINYISFPAVSCGVYGFPYEEAAETALTTVQESAGDIKEVHFVLFEMSAWKAWLEKAQDLFDKLSE